MGKTVKELRDKGRYNREKSKQKEIRERNRDGDR